VLARWRAQALPLAVLLIGLLATAWVTRAQYQDVQAAQHRHFESHVAHIVDDARRSLTRPLDLLLSVRAALVTARGVALESELQAYATARGVAGDHPGLLGIGLIERRAEAGPGWNATAPHFVLVARSIGTMYCTAFDPFGPGVTTRTAPAGTPDRPSAFCVDLDGPLL
jgi:CHASE1-domain containing sensor protein